MQKNGKTFMESALSPALENFPRVQNRRWYWFVVPVFQRMKHGTPPNVLTSIYFRGIVFLQNVRSRN